MILITTTLITKAMVSVLYAGIEIGIIVLGAKKIIKVKIVK